MLAIASFGHLITHREFDTLAVVDSPELAVAVVGTRFTNCTSTGLVSKCHDYLDPMRRSLSVLISLLVSLAPLATAKPSKAPAKAVAQTPTPPAEAAYPDMQPIARTFFSPYIHLMLQKVAWDPMNALPLDMTHCMAKLGADVTSWMIATNLAKVLTAPEAVTTLEFLTSPTGQKYIERQRPIVKTKGVFNQHPVFVAEELNEIRAFANTSAGRKLMGDFRHLPALRDAMFSVLDQSILRCGVPEFFTSPEGEAFLNRLSAMRRAPLGSATQSSGGASRHTSSAPLDTLEVNSTQLACTLPRPVYPVRAAPLSGKAIVRMLVHEDGTVIEAVVAESSGVFVLDDAAETAVKNMRCKPFIDRGRPIKVTATQPIDFVAN